MDFCPLRPLLSFRKLTSQSNTVTSRGANPCRLLKKLKSFADFFLFFWLSTLHMRIYKFGQITVVRGGERFVGLSVFLA